MSQFTMPTRVFSGKKAFDEAVPYIASLGRRPLIVTGKHVGASQTMEYICERLEDSGLSPVIFDGITGEPTDVMIDDGVRAFRDNKSDFVIGVGGGSPLDSAKAISAMSVLEGSIADYNGRELNGEFPKIVAVATTAGTGSEVTKYSVITSVKDGIKMLLKGSVLPDIAVADPLFTMDCPKNVTAATGMDAFTHAVEAYTSIHAFPLSDVYALDAAEKIYKYLPQAYADGNDEEAREQMSLAALEAGFTINNSTVTIVHGMSRPIGALFHVPHGISNAMLITECLSYAAEGAVARFAVLGRALGAAGDDSTDEEAKDAFIECIRKLCRSVDIPTLREYGIDKDKFTAAIDKMAHDAIASGSPGNTIRDVSEEDIKRIYHRVIEA